MKKLLLFPIIVSFILFSSLAMADGDIQYGSSGANAGSDSAASTTIGDIGSNNTNQPTKTKRFFLNAGEVNYPGMPGRFDQPPARFGYMNMLQVQDITEYDEDGLTINEAMKMAKGVGGKRIMVRAKYGKVAEDQRLPKDAAMSVVYEKAKGMKSLGIIVIVSSSKKAISPDVFAQAQVEAWKLGGTMMHVKAQGFQRQVHTSGKGIGFSWTGTTISSGQTSATTGVFGFGASWGQAGYYDHPFVIMHVLVPKV